jgi:hypothetical protein
MALSIVKIDELPLGCRVLRFGCYGQDVIELQKLLKEAGFYFDEPDGWYGVLTGEAVTLLQRTYRLRVDGIAGSEVLDVLLKKASKKGRIIYRVKKDEGLDLISKQFGVKESAWRRIPGQGDPHKKIYPGLKMLLHEKVFLSWDFPCPEIINFPVTGTICTDYQMKMDGDSIFIASFQNNTQTPESLLYHVIGSSEEAWVKVLSSPKLWAGIADQLKSLKKIKFGFDLREVPTEKFPRWGDFLKLICRTLEISELEFQVLPLLPVKRKLENRLYWSNLPILSSFTKYVLLEPAYNIESPDIFLESVIASHSDIAKIIKLGLAEKVILVCRTNGWNWNLDQNCFEPVSFKVAQLLRGQYLKRVQHSMGSKLSRIDYQKHHQHYCLIYRDEEGWREFLNRMIALNLAGIVMVNFKDLGKAGPNIITGSFKVRDWGGYS